MSIRAYSVVAHELKQLRSFYDATLLAFNRVTEIQNASRASKALESALLDNGVRWSKGENRNRKAHRKQKLESILRELILVRSISALETFLIDAIRDVFVVTKAPFMDESIRLNFSQEELIANSSPTKLFARIINRETRKLTSGGFSEFIKYYKKRFEIDLSQIRPGYKRMNEYHDVRHILVHRLGKTDAIFRKQYRTDAQKVSVDPTFLEALLDDLDGFVREVALRVSQVIESFESIAPEYNARYVVDILIHGAELPTYLHPSYQFWADDEYIMMRDVLVGTSPMEDGWVKYYFNGSDRALRHLRKILKKEDRKGLISIRVALTAFLFDNKRGSVPEEITQLVSKELPAQPWPSGIHKEVARTLGISNGKVSAAIDVLIERGIFKNQVDGKIIDNRQ